MRTFREIRQNIELSGSNRENIQEGVLSAFAFERKLKFLSSEILSTRDLDKKIDILGKMLHLSAGANLLQIHKKRKS